MIIIYNLSGLLIGVLGFVLGIFAGVITGQMWLGFLVIGSVWLWVSLWWRKGTPQSGKRPFPSIFFIPLPFWAILVVPLAVGSVFVQRAASLQANDPRASRLNTAQDGLRAAILTGDEALARRVHEGVSRARYSGAAPASVAVYAERKDDAILVIVKISNFRKFSDAAKGEALTAVQQALSEESGKKIYAGIMGFASFGAVITPEARQVAGFVAEDALFEFYGPAPAPQPAR